MLTLPALNLDIEEVEPLISQIRQMPPDVAESYPFEQISQLSENDTRHS